MSLAEFFQTDAAINRGNSGGPMFSLRGEVIGIVSHNISKSGGFEGLGLVVTSNMALMGLRGGTIKAAIAVNTRRSTARCPAGSHRCRP